MDAYNKRHIEEKRLKDTDNVGKKEHLLLPLRQQIKQKRQ